MLGGEEDDFVGDHGAQLGDRERARQRHLSSGDELPDAEDEGRVRSVSVKDHDSVRADRDGPGTE